MEGKQKKVTLSKMIMLFKNSILTQLVGKFAYF